MENNLPKEVEAFREWCAENCARIAQRLHAKGGPTQAEVVRRCGGRPSAGTLSGLLNGKFKKLPDFWTIVKVALAAGASLSPVPGVPGKGYAMPEEQFVVGQGYVPPEEREILERLRALGPAERRGVFRFLKLQVKDG
jgi:hypothetical protein